MSRVRIAFVSPIDLRQFSAHRIYVLKSCAALSRAGLETTLVVPRNGLRRDEFQIVLDRALDECGVREQFHVVAIPRPTLRGRFKRSFSFLSGLYVWRESFDICWSRDIYSADVTTRLHIPTLADQHIPLTRKQFWAVRRMTGRRSFAGLVTISKQLMETDRLQGLDETRIVAAPSATNFHACPARDRFQLRRELNLPDSFMVMYTGSFYVGRGIECLLEAAKDLPGVSFVLAGGSDSDVARARERADASHVTNMIFIGRVAHSEIPRYLAASDVLAAPYTLDSQGIDGTPIGAIQSPIKIFEYMAAGKPIVASRLKGIEEVLEDGKTALLVPPGDSKELAAAVRRLMREPGLGSMLGKAAGERAGHYTYDGRVEHVLGALGLLPEERKGPSGP